MRCPVETMGHSRDDCAGSAGSVEQRGGEGCTGPRQHTGPPLEDTSKASGSGIELTTFPRRVTAASQGCSAFTGAGLLEGISWVVGDVAARVYTFD